MQTYQIFSNKKWTNLGESLIKIILTPATIRIVIKQKVVVFEWFGLVVDLLFFHVAGLFGCVYQMWQLCLRLSFDRRRGLFRTWTVHSQLHSQPMPKTTSFMQKLPVAFVFSYLSCRKKIIFQFLVHIRTYWELADTHWSPLVLQASNEVQKRLFLSVPIF